MQQTSTCCKRCFGIAPLDPKDGLFPLFARFKFTVEENTPLDQEVALDPELLGRVFENLLAAYNPETRNTVRKATGSYYTPRRIVDYMVDEALAAALMERVEPTDGDRDYLDEALRYLLDYQDACEDAAELFTPADTEAVIRAIANLRVLDPAVGSGAFPMGVLHKLTLVLRRLDPQNVHWERLQKELAGERARAAFESGTRDTRDAELLEISETFEAYRDSDFGRKLYLIQNSIYGVDIQPIACQIARLRFFISLTVEQQATDDPATNYGIRPLPNLETRIVAADALVSVTGPQPGLAEPALRKHIDRLLAVREQHYNARTRDRKIQLRKRDANERKRLATTLESLGWGHEEAQRIAHWDPYGLNVPADWFDAKWMFGIDGFDVLIGNPPYIQLQRNRGELGRQYRSQSYGTFAATGDIYQLFYERGLRLLNRRGVLTYITSNSWLKAKYGERMRAWLSKTHTPRLLLEVGKDIFDSAIVDTSILVVQEGREGSQERECPALDLDVLDSFTDKQFPPPKQQFGSLYSGGNAPWVAMSSVERDIMEKMRRAGTPLSEWDISINYGIKTGYNEAFIVSSEVRDQLVAEDPASVRILKPILRGRDIRPYRAHWAGLWLVDTHNGFDATPAVQVTDYPAIQRHLDQYWEAIVKRQDQGATPYNLRNCAYHEQFATEKLIWMDMSPVGRFWYSSSEIFGNDKTFLMTGSHLKYLCAFMNSSLVTWYVGRTGLTTGVGLVQWKKFTVESVPVPVPESTEEDAWSEQVDIACRGTSAPTEATMHLDEMVFSAYSLDKRERDYMRARR